MIGGGGVFSPPPAPPANQIKSHNLVYSAVFFRGDIPTDKNFQKKPGLLGTPSDVCSDSLGGRGGANYLNLVLVWWASAAEIFGSVRKIPGAPQKRGVSMTYPRRG